MKTRKRVLSGLLCAVMALSAAALPAWAAPEEETAARVYADVPADAWYAEAVYWCLEQGLMSGTSAEPFLFSPDARMDRATLATVLYRLAGSPEVSEMENPFSDVEAGQWYTSAVLWADAMELMQGYGDGRFGPKDKVNRAHIVTTLWRMAGRPLPDGTVEDYSDVAEIDEWAALPAEWGRENSILPEREDGAFAGREEVPRCEIAPSLRAWDLYKNPPPPTIWEQFETAFGYRPQPAFRTVNTYRPSAFQLVEMPYSESEALPGFAPSDPEVEPEPPLKYMTYQAGHYAMGIDVSAHQKEVDWQAVADSGIQFAMLRVGYRGYTAGRLNRDSYFKRNIEGALAAGLDVGVYLFSQAVTIEEAVEEANYTLDAIRGYEIAYPVVFDWEKQKAASSRTKDTDDTTVVACAIAFCETVEEAGYIPAVYGSRNKLNRLEMGYLADYPVWLAHYTPSQIPSDYAGGYDMWQYSSKWSVPGVEGNCDVNICLTDWEQWRLDHGYPSV